ncbi:MAG: restriction endonuclease [Deltaproteobacteria bacterium]|uniref:Restriction endonuclease n=1 Tax=Candidatus Zymogenus saltonus TaxID=2844893 RepID=A0A9D8KEP2_9DELT|nr:restriction endonuclease [Candidatus Zymogenus saltonus]
MRIVAVYSHLNGLEHIKVHKEYIWTEIQDVIAQTNAELCKTKVSKEKTMKGKLLYSPDDMNKSIRSAFEKREWKQQRTSYWVTEDAKLIRKTMKMPPEEQKAEILASGHKAIYSYNQTDFVKERVAVEVQFGKYSFVAYDLFVKHMAFYVGDLIDVGVEILPMKELQAEMSSGPGYYESELYNLIREGRGVPAVPLILVGVAQ